MNLKQTINHSKIYIKYGLFLGLFLWGLGFIGNGKKFLTLPNFFIMVSLGLFVILIKATSIFIDKKYYYPKYVDKIRNYPAFIELELVKGFVFVENLNWFKGHYKGFDFNLSIELHKETNKFQMWIYLERDLPIAEQIRKQSTSYEIDVFEDCFSVTLQRSIPFEYDDLEIELNYFVETLKSYNAKNKQFEMEDE